MLILQLGLCVLHFIIFDIWGGFMMLLTSFFGYQVYKDNMDFMWAMCYGLIITMELIFDLIHLVIRYTQVPEPFFKKLLILDIILIASPIISFIQAWMMYRVYSSALNEENDTLMGNERFSSGRPAPTMQPPRGGPVGGGGGGGNARRPHDWNTAGQGHTIG
jgi:hypothetical protein